MRNFGLSRPEAVGGNQLPGSRTDANSTRVNSNIIQLVQPHPPGGSGLNSAGHSTASPLFIDDPVGAILERGQIGESSSDVFEPGSYLLFFFVLLGPAICVLGAVAIYLLLVS